MPRYDVFLSHANADKPAIEHIARKLREEKLEPFLDKWHLIPGDPWEEALEEALDESRTCAVFLGKELGPWQNQEMRSALAERVRDQSIRVIPVLLPGWTTKGEVPRFLRLLAWVDFRAGIDDEEAFRRLLAGIRGKVPGPGEGGELLPGPFIKRSEHWAGWPTAALLSLLLATIMGIAGCNWWKERLVTQGVAFFEHGQWSEARKQFRDALKLAPGKAEILSNLAATEERLGDVRAAEDHYRAAVKQRPDSAEHLFNLGHYLNGRERFADAYPFLLQASVREPERVDAYGELAHAALALNMLSRARAALSTGLRLDPDRPALHRLYGELELRAGQPQAAIPHLEEARNRYVLGDLGRIETFWLLIQAYDQLGNVPSACRQVYEFRRLDGAKVTPWAPHVEAVAAKHHCSS